jgi:hypothetical protein
MTDRRLSEAMSPFPEVSDLAVVSSLLYWLLVAVAVVGLLRFAVGRASDGSKPADSDETDAAEPHSNS